MSQIDKFFPNILQIVHFHSGGLRINPNLYASGKVCLSLLNTWFGTECEMWSPSNSTMLQVLVSIQALVLNDRPFFNEPGYEETENTEFGKLNSLAYNEDAFLLSCRTMLYSLRKPPMVRYHLHLQCCCVAFTKPIPGKQLASSMLVMQFAMYLCNESYRSTFFCISKACYMFPDFPHSSPVCHNKFSENFLFFLTAFW